MASRKRKASRRRRQLAGTAKDTGMGLLLGIGAVVALALVFKFGGLSPEQKQLPASA